MPVTCKAFLTSHHFVLFTFLEIVSWTKLLIVWGKNSMLYKLKILIRNKVIRKTKSKSGDRDDVKIRIPHNSFFWKLEFESQINLRRTFDLTNMSPRSCQKMSWTMKPDLTDLTLVRRCNNDLGEWKFGKIFLREIEFSGILKVQNLPF